MEKLNCIKYFPRKLPKNKKRTIYEATDKSFFTVGDGDIEKLSWYKNSIFYDLIYWSSHKVRHTIDVMHTEKNVAEHLINLMFDKGNQSSKFAWDKIHKMKCCQVLKDAKLPSCLATRFGSLVTIQPPTLHIKKNT